MSELTKITVLGRARRVTLVVPADEPFGAHLAEIARLLDEPAARAALTTPSGDQLDLALAPVDQGVLDGAVLRLVDVEQLPAPPEVTDVTDRVAELRDAASGVWSPGHARVAAAIALGALSAAGGTALGAVAGGWAVVGLLVAATLGATVAGLLARPTAAALSLGAALGATLPVGTWVAVSLDASPLAPAGVLPALIVGLAWLVVALAVGLGRRSTGAALGATVGILLTAAVLAPPLVGVELAPTAGIVATLAILALGVLPAVAVATSGLGALDDEVIAGSLPSRDRVATSLRDAFRVTSWAVVAVAVWVAPVIGVLVATGELWPMLLGGAVALVALLRTRVLPLAVPTWALGGAAVVGGLGGLLAAPVTDGVRLLVLGVVAVAVVLIALVRPSAHGRIRLRRLGDLLEAVAAVAIVPFLLGVFGVYEALLGAFA